MASISELVEGWSNEWIPRIQREMHDLHHRREVHDGVIAMLEASGDDDGVFQDAFHRMYLESQLTAIRRQANTDSRTIFLRRLIGQLDLHRKLFTRVAYVDRWMMRLDDDGPGERKEHFVRMQHDMAHLAFDKFADDGEPDCLGGRRLAEDQERLLTATKAVASFVNKEVAHSDRSGVDEPVTYEMFHTAMDELGELLRRFYLLIVQDSLVSVKPTIQSDWRRPFRQPLIVSGPRGQALSSVHGHHTPRSRSHDRCAR